MSPAEIAAWREMDAWLKKRGARATAKASAMIMQEHRTTDDPAFCRLVGEANAIGAMRSYIHGALTVRAHLEKNDDRS